MLLDECIDRRFANELAGHDVRTVPQMGWKGLKNGDLLQKAVGTFDAFVTVDRNLSFQQNLPLLRIAVFVLSARTNRLADLKPLAPKLLAFLADPHPGTVTVVQ